MKFLNGLFGKRFVKHVDMDELDREIHDHMLLEAEAQQENGASRAEAESAAKREIGNILQIKESVYESTWSGSIDRWLKDTQIAVRGLLRDRAFTVVTVLSLALGIGSTAAIFTIADQALFRSLPIPSPSQLVQFRWQGRFIGGSSRGYATAFSYPAFRELERQHGPAIANIAARWQEPVSISLNSETQRGFAEVVSGGYFNTIGVHAALGRLLAPEDDQEQNAEPYVVLSYAYWTARFGANPSILGSTVHVNGYPMTIIGVAQPAFFGFDPLTPSDIFMPLAMKQVATPTWDDRQRRDSIWLRLFARLNAGYDHADLEASLMPALRAVLQQDLLAHPRPAKFSSEYSGNRLEFVDASRGLAEGTVGTITRPLYVLLAMSGLLLLSAAVNVTNLLIARTARRRREISIRVSLGASRIALARFTCSEVLLLVSAAATAALILSYSLAGALLRMFPSDRILMSVHARPDVRILSFTVALALAAGVIIGTASTLHICRRIATADRSGALRSGAGVGGQTRLRRSLVASQLTMSLLLLVGALLFARTVHNVFAVNPGFSTERVLTFAVDTVQAGYSPAQSRSIAFELQNRIQHLPEIREASAASFPLLSGSSWQNGIRVEGYQPQPGESMQASWNQTMPGFFSTIGATLLLGRDFSPRENEGPARVVIVNESLANRFFGSPANAIGRRLGPGALEWEVVGVVKDVKLDNLREDVLPATFTPAQWSKVNFRSGMTFYVATQNDPERAIQSVRRVVQELAPAVPIYDVKTLQRQLEETHFTEISMARLGSMFAIPSILLATIGLYGVIAFGVTNRSSEIGLRIALGATRRSIVYLVLREGIATTAIGVGAGLLLAFHLSKALQGFLFGIQPTDTVTLASAALSLGLISLFASCIPAAQALRVAPMKALRLE